MENTVGALPPNINAAIKNLGGTVRFRQGWIALGTDYEQTGGSTTFDAVTVSINGNVIETGGTVTVDVGSTVTVVQDYTQIGGQLSVVGSLTVASDYALEAGTILISPGCVSDTFHIEGNYTQLSSGTLVMDANSSANDVLHISGLATLGGTFVLNALNGWVPAPDTLLWLIEYGSYSGAFTTLSLPTPSQGSWVASYHDPSHPGWFSLLVSQGGPGGGGEV
jgi:hypothetical protein